MTDYPFPPEWWPLPAWAIATIPFVIAALLLGSVAFAIWRGGRPAAWRDLAVWIAVFAGATVLGMRISPSETYGTLTGVAMFLTDLVAVVATLQLVYRKWLGGSAGGALARSVATVIPFIVILMVPVQHGHPDASHRSQCRTNLKQIALAFHNFLDDRGHLPLPRFVEASEPPRSWRVELLPFLEQSTLRKRYADAQPWDSPENAELLPLRPSFYLCPATPAKLTRTNPEFASYAMPTGPHTFGTGRKLAVGDLSNGFSRTVLIVEACGLNLVWLQPVDAEANEQTIGINLPGHRSGYSRGVFSAYHPKSVNVAMADGAVRTLNDQTDPRVLRALLTIDGGE